MTSPRSTDRPRASSTTATFQRATIACQSCRQRKVKCDAQSTVADEGCGPCRRAGQECLLDPLSNGRRSVNRKYVDKLQRRIEMLEALSQRMDQRSEGQRSGVSPLSREGPLTLPCGSSNTHLTDVAITSSPHGNENGNVAASRISPSCLPLLLGDGTIPESTDHDSPSFYGATSHPHVISSTEDCRPSGLDDIDTVSIDLDPASPHLKEQLFQSFFKYQSLWVDIVDKETFLAHKTNGNQSRWYSKFLEHVILASGTRLSTSKSVRALGSRYREWAKEEVLKAMTEPTPANLQGFLLLSEYEVTKGNDRPGWMFCGVACRMLSDLGLHELASTTGTLKESDLAYALLSACVVYEGVWTLYLGRPSSIPTSIMNIAASRCREKRKSDSPWLNAWVGLCIPMAKATHMLNEQCISDSDRSSALGRLVKDVEEWYGHLPPELMYQENRLTSMDLSGYGLHSQYCKVLILLRRALYCLPNPRKRRYSEMGSSEETQTALDERGVTTYQYALRIARLVVTYREVFGMEKIPSIMLDNAVVAATTMIRHLNDKTASARGQAQQEMIWLRQLIKSLESVQPHFPIIGRMLDCLEQIRNGTSTDGNASPQTRRDYINVITCGQQDSSVAHPREGQSSTTAPACDNPVATQAPAQLLSASNHFQNLGSSKANEIPGNSLGLVAAPDVIWDWGDTGFGTDLFSTGGFDDLFSNIPPTEAFISSLAQSVS